MTAAYCVRHAGFRTIGRLVARSVELVALLGGPAARQPRFVLRPAARTVESSAGSAVPVVELGRRCHRRRSRRRPGSVGAGVIAGRRGHWPARVRPYLPGAPTPSSVPILLYRAARRRRARAWRRLRPRRKLAV